MKEVFSGQEEVCLLFGRTEKMSLIFMAMIAKSKCTTAVCA